MEYFPSQPYSTLLQVAARRSVVVPPAVVAGMLADACAGLEAAHQLRDARGERLNVVHRDATPSNLLVGEDGSTKVADFGVARVESAAFEQLTGESGLTKGKLSYLSPEQVLSKPVDGRTDVFTLGAVLFETLAGRKLFRADNELALAHAIVDGPMPDLRALAPDAPEALVAIAQRALRRDPAERFASAAEMQEALITVQRALPQVARAPFVRELLGPLFEARRAEISAAEAALDADAPDDHSAPRAAHATGAALTSSADASEAPTTVRAMDRAVAPAPEDTEAPTTVRGLPVESTSVSAPPAATTKPAVNAPTSQSAIATVPLAGSTRGTESPIVARAGTSARDAAPSSTPMRISIGISVAILAGGVWFAMSRPADSGTRTSQRSIAASNTSRPVAVEPPALHSAIAPAAPTALPTAVPAPATLEAAAPPAQADAAARGAHRHRASPRAAEGTGTGAATPAVTPPAGTQRPQDPANPWGAPPARRRLEL
ncbi:MAG: protein kinase [Deltaproteobacteria bacterium]